jgi:hypothetical protein
MALGRMSKRRMMVRDLLACAILCLLASGYALGQGLFAKLKDTEDGAFDLSDFLLSHTGFLPVPIIITEPAIGYGGGLAPFVIKRNAPSAEEAERGRSGGVLSGVSRRGHGPTAASGVPDIAPRDDFEPTSIVGYAFSFAKGIDDAPNQTSF